MLGKRWRLGAGTTMRSARMAPSGRGFRLHCSLVTAHPARHHDQRNRLNRPTCEKRGVDQNVPSLICWPVTNSWFPRRPSTARLFTRRIFVEAACGCSVGPAIDAARAEASANNERWRLDEIDVRHGWLSLVVGLQVAEMSRRLRLSCHGTSMRTCCGTWRTKRL